AAGPGGARLSQYLFEFEELFLFEAGVIVAALRAVFAVFGTGTGLDGQQRAQLHFVGVEVLAVHGLGAEQQIIERQGEQRQGLVAGPVVADGSGVRAVHRGVRTIVARGMAIRDNGRNDNRAPRAVNLEWTYRLT